MLDKLNDVYYIYVVNKIRNLMGTKERKERDKKEMIEQILNAAMKLFLDHGYKNVTLRKIAETIEYSPATIYLYFKDKDEILTTLQDRAFEKFYHAQKSVQKIEDPLERLSEHGKVYVQFALENPEYYDLMFIMNEPVEKIKRPEEWRTGMNSYELLKQNVKECIDKDLLKIDNVEIASFVLWSFVHGVASIIIKRGMMVPEEYRESMLQGVFMVLKTIWYK